jgi:hypothetical protein
MSASESKGKGKAVVEEEEVEEEQEGGEAHEEAVQWHQERPAKDIPPPGPPRFALVSPVSQHSLRETGMAIGKL